MQSALNTNQNSLSLVDAKSLREMTVSKEDLYSRQRTNVLESIMEAMVKTASEQGNNTFDARLQPNFDPTLLNDIVTELKGLGYETSVNEIENPAVGKYISLLISW